MREFNYPDGSVFRAADQRDGVLIDPELPADFDNTPNEERPPSHMRWWEVPFIRTESVEALDAHYAAPETAREYWSTNGRQQWLQAWPSGTRYEVRCLDGGAWDRATSWGMFASLDEAVRCAKDGRKTRCQ